MADNNAMRNRADYIDNAVEEAQKGKPAKKKPKKKPKNPYPPGSARAKLWARRQAEKVK